MKLKKGQNSGSGAAILIGIIALMVILYIMFLPADDRAALLGEGSSFGGGSVGCGSTGGSSQVLQSKGDTILTVSPGKFNYQSLDAYEYDLPAFSIYQVDKATVLAEGGNFYIKRGWYENSEKEFIFNVDNIEEVSGVALSLSFKKFVGVLTVTVNGKEIYNYEPIQGNLGPLQIKKTDLEQGENIVKLSLSTVGLRFWAVNEYHVENIQVTGVVHDYSRSESQMYFHISPEEGERIEKATFKFNPDCKPGDVGMLKISLNDRNIFSGIPDCGILNKHTISPTMLNVGKNRVNFETDKGSYLIDQIMVKTELKEPVQPTYYFDLSDSLFLEKKADIDRCGESDGVCPEDCDADVDKDCCFDEYPVAYWCDAKTEILDDRCVGNVYNATCGRCLTGYEEENGDPAEECEDRCGDDTDNFCPVGCSANYDQDCCEARAGDQYWCDDLPITGLEYACVDSLSYDSCKYCLTGYEGEDRDPKCEFDEDLDDEEEKLKSGYHIVLKFEFTEDIKTKEAKFFINGYETGFETKADTYDKRIDDFVESGTNSIKIYPKSDLDIRTISVEIED